MKREIKFRVWEHDIDRTGIMYSFDEIKKFDNPQLTLGDYILYPNGNRNIILMQFTGLKDKNGKEIYEGDILNVSNGSINGTLWMDKPYAVDYLLTKGWNMCMFCWDKEGNSQMDSTHWCEIIGNIYENPELLK